MITKYITLPLISYYNTKCESPEKNYISGYNYRDIRIENYIVNVTDLDDKIITDKIVHKIIFLYATFIPKYVDNNCIWFSSHNITRYITF